MQKIKIVLILLLCSIPLFAQKIQSYSSYFIDDSNTLSIENVYNNKDTFTQLKNSGDNFGILESTIWIYVKVTNKSEQTQSNIIKFDYPLIDYIHVYEYIDSHIDKEYLTGDLVPFDTRSIDSNDFVIPYTLDSNQSKEFIFKINSEGALNLGMKFLSNDEYYAELKNTSLVLGNYYGAVILMLIYNFILFLMIKDKVYLQYVIFHFAFFLTQLGLNGFTFQYLWPTLPQLNVYFVPLALIATNYFSIPFSIAFLNIKKKYPKIHKYFKILMLLFSLEVILVFTLPYFIIIKFIGILSIINVSSLLIVGIYILVVESSLASKFFVSAWGFLLVGVLLTELQNFGILPTSFIVFYGTQIGAFFELALFAFALANRYNDIFLKLQKTELSLRVLNKDLEVKVIERTQTLDQKNSDLMREVNNKNILLRELYHRVKNNLQIITGILSLQSKRIKDKTAHSIFIETNQRIKSMAMIHENLFQSNDLEYINMQAYINELSQGLLSSFSSPDLSIEINSEDVNVDLQVAVPMGLIINELVTNAIKHAFDSKDSTNKIVINIDINENNDLRLEVYDNGKGMDIENNKKGFGFRLLESLVTYQLDGTIHIYNDNGLHYEITFNKELLE